MTKTSEETFIIRAGGKNKLTGTRDFLEGMISQLGLPYRWSSSKEDFIQVKDMHDNHLLNSIKEEISLCGDKDDFLFVLNGPLMTEFSIRLDQVEV